MTLREKLRQRWFWGVWAVAILLVAMVSFAVQPSSAANAAAAQQAAALAQGLTCTKTDKANGGFILDCDPQGGTPSPSTSVSPSSTPTASPSPSPSTSTVTPSPSTSPPAGGTNCQADPGRCGFPNDLNTGPASALTPSTRTQYATAGETVSGVAITGCVEVHAANVTFRNVQFNAGGCFWGVRNFTIRSDGAVIIDGPGLKVIDSALTCASTNGTGFGSSDLSLLRVDISRCENGLNVAGRVTVTDSWIHAMNGSSGGAHTDGAQFNQGASDIVFQHNTINVGPQNGATSAIIMWDEGGAQNARVTVNGNLLAGGTYTLYCGREGAVDNVRITNNRFGTFEFGYANACDTGEIWTGNVRDSTGLAIGAQ
jgi:hypothetical protein